MRQLLLFGLILSMISCNKSKKNTDSTTAFQNLDKTDHNYSVYTNKDKGFSISYPTKWDTSRKDPNMVFLAIENDPDTADKFNEAINVSVFPNEELTLEQMVEENIQIAKKYYQNPEIGKTSIKNKNGMNCIVLQIKLNRKGLSLISYSAFFGNEINLFTVTQTIESSKKNKYLPIINTVINSFKLIKNK
jgi:hypothetical protein